MSIVKLEIINDAQVKWIKVLLKMNGFIPRVDFISESDIDGLEVMLISVISPVDSYLFNYKQFGTILLSHRFFYFHFCNMLALISRPYFKDNHFT